MNIFSKLNSIALVSYFLTIIIVIMFCSDPILQIIAIISGGIYLTWLKNGKGFLSDFIFYIILFILIAITNPLFSHNGKTPLFFMNSNPVTLEALLKGLSIATSLVGACFWFGCCSKIFTSEKILQLIGNISPKLALVFSMTLHFIPSLKYQFSKTENSQKSLGIFSCESRFDRLKLKLSTLASVMMFSAENSVEISDSMNARGLGLKGRTSYNYKKITFSESLIFLYSLLVLSEILVFEFFEIIAFDYYPSVSNININFLSLTAYFSFGFLCFLPIILEIVECVRWKFFVSKI